MEPEWNTFDYIESADRLQRGSGAHTGRVGGMNREKLITF